VPLSERFGSGLGTTIGIQLKPGAGDPVLEVTSVRILASNIESRRRVLAQIVVNDAIYDLDLTFYDETFYDRTDTGGTKRRANLGTS